MMAQEENAPKPKSKTKPMSETRKIRKPLMERKRRERINASLSELARLLTEARKVKAEGGKATKLEKADILELTVKHLQSVNNNEDPNKIPKISDEEKYQEGFSECIRVVEKALKKSTTEELRERLLTHLYGRLKVLKATRKRNLAEEKQNEKENRLSDTDEDDLLLINRNQETKPNLNEKCSFTLVPTELPDGGMAFVLTGNPQKLLKEWENLPLEARLSTPKINTKTESSIPVHSSAPTNTSSEFTDSSLLVKQQISNTTLQCNLSTKHSNVISPSTSSVSSSQIKIKQNDKTYHTLQPLNPHIYYSSSAGYPSSSKPQNKSHCPPTPPPSPPTTDGRKSSQNDSLQQQQQQQQQPPPPVNADREIPEERMEVEHDMNEPFDLSVTRMWRPW